MKKKHATNFIRRRIQLQQYLHFTIEVGRREVLIYINLHVQVKGYNNVFTYFLLEIGEKCTKYN